MVGGVEKGQSDLEDDLKAFKLLRNHENVRGKTVLFLVNKNVKKPEYP